MASSLENDITHTGKAFDMDGLDPAIPPSLALVCETALEGIRSIG
jgi:hypothetical protein